MALKDIIPAIIGATAIGGAFLLLRPKKAAPSEGARLEALGRPTIS